MNLEQIVLSLVMYEFVRFFSVEKTGKALFLNKKDAPVSIVDFSPSTLS
jgi:hypothetical protein